VTSSEKTRSDDDPPRVAVVTGAGRGIGRGIAAALLRDGSRVIIVDRHPERAAASVAALGSGCESVVADIATAAGTALLAEEVLARCGRWDVLVNNAAALRFGSVESTTEDDWDAVFAGCVRSAWLCLRAATPHLRAAGGGRVINVVSVVAQGAPSADLVAYTAAKAALMGLTIAAARELGPDGITVNAVSPGAVETDAWQKFPDPDGLRRARAQAAVLGRVGTPEDVGEAVRYLASPSASFVTGQVLVVDGGRADKL
jgi:NAD(P)-dependent dehydrogenase (short-subunit alcohol dehydrogenase family)